MYVLKNITETDAIVIGDPKHPLSTIRIVASGSRFKVLVDGHLTVTVRKPEKKEVSDG